MNRKLLYLLLLLMPLFAIGKSTMERPLIGISCGNDLINITVRLLEEGFSEDDIAKIWGGNFLRVMTEVQRK